VLPAAAELTVSPLYIARIVTEPAVVPVTVTEQVAELVRVQESDENETDPGPPVCDHETVSPWTDPE
jgi:hypothetical protein